MKPESKTIELGGKWKAEIKRPSWGVYVGWRQIVNPKMFRQSTDPRYTENADESAIWSYAEKNLIPDAVLSFTNEEERVLKVSEVYLPDLGMVRFLALISGIDAMIREADEAAFRDHEDAEGNGEGNDAASTADASPSK